MRKKEESEEVGLLIETKLNEEATWWIRFDWVDRTAMDPNSKWHLMQTHSGGCPPMWGRITSCYADFLRQKLLWYNHKLICVCTSSSSSRTIRKTKTPRTGFVFQCVLRWSGLCTHFSVDVHPNSLNSLDPNCRRTWPPTVRLCWILSLDGSPISRITFSSLFVL
jgi:hypothetical protein